MYCHCPPTHCEYVPYCVGGLKAPSVQIAACAVPPPMDTEQVTSTATDNACKTELNSALKAPPNFAVTAVLPINVTDVAIC